MGIRLDITGDKSLTDALRNYGNESIQAVETAVSVTALDVQADAVKSIQRGSKTGLTYQKYNPKRTHRASAPGEAPASDTGRGAGSIDAVKFTPLTWEVGTLLRYLADLEFGTQRIAERPWLRPAIQRGRAEFFRRLKAAITSK